MTADLKGVEDDSPKREGEREGEWKSRQYIVCNSGSRRLLRSVKDASVTPEYGPVDEYEDVIAWRPDTTD
jgi:hypothetical protein